MVTKVSRIIEYGMVSKVTVVVSTKYEMLGGVYSMMEPGEVHRQITYLNGRVGTFFTELRISPEIIPPMNVTDYCNYHRDYL